MITDKKQQQRRYDFNASVINDYTQYYFDIYQSNLNNRPVWMRYDWKNFPTFNPLKSDLNMNSVKYLSELIKTDSRVMMEYHNVRFGHYLNDRAKVCF